MLELINGMSSMIPGLPITHRWPSTARRSIVDLARSTKVALDLLRPIPMLPVDSWNVSWDRAADWMGLVAVALHMVLNGRRALVLKGRSRFGMSLTKSAGRLVALVTGASLIHVITYWTARSPLWASGALWLLSVA